MSWAWPLVALALVALYGMVCLVHSAPDPRAPEDRLSATVRVWLADPRPAWETVQAFEADVQRIVFDGPAWAEAVPVRPADSGRSATLILTDGLRVRPRGDVSGDMARITRALIIAPDLQKARWYLDREIQRREGA